MPLKLGLQHMGACVADLKFIMLRGVSCLIWDSVSDRIEKLLQR